MAEHTSSLLLIHGFPLDSSLWHDQRMALADVAHVLAPDLRGFGADEREVPEVLRMEDFAEDLKELLDRNGIDRVVLCGLSMGGYIAFTFLERWPERVAGLILCNTRATADDAAGRDARVATARDAREKGMAVMARAMAAKVLGARTVGERPDIVDRAVAMIARQRPGATAAAALGMAQRPDRMEVLHRITVPTLIITGDEDALMPLPTSQAMADRIPNARLVIIPGAGHLSNVEAPEAFNTAVRNFLAELAGTR